MNSKFSKTLLLTTAAVLSTDSYVKAASDWGACKDKPTTVGNFNVNEFQTGDWYELLRDGATWWQGGESCVAVQYSDYAGWFTDKAIKKDSYDKTAATYSTVDNLVKFDETGKGWVRFDWLFMDTAYHVLDTDYSQYAVVYGCDNWFWGWWHTEQVWILGREPESSDTILEKAQTVLGNLVPSYDQAAKFLLLDQEDCKYKNPIVDEATSELDDILKETDA